MFRKIVLAAIAAAAFACGGVEGEAEWTASSGSGLAVNDGNCSQCHSKIDPIAHAPLANPPVSAWGGGLAENAEPIRCSACHDYLDH